MCFLALLYKVVPGYSIVVGANRDEFYDRPGLPPSEIETGVYAGLDPLAGGTWLGVNDAGILVAVTNLGIRRGENPQARSRGLLCRDLLEERSFAALRGALEASVRREIYNGFNLVAASRHGAWWATFADRGLAVRALEPGIHVVVNRPQDAGEDSKATRGRSLIRASRDLSEVLANLAGVCADHGIHDDGSDAICVHGDGRGTVSSSLIALQDGHFSRSIYRHAQGVPCEFDYRDLSDLFHR
jgi:uncharacterized protein with NRDE domain